jgi:hypothetical protein
MEHAFRSVNNGTRVGGRPPAFAEKVSVPSQPAQVGLHELHDTLGVTFLIFGELDLLERP